jgi:hypothetical protein
MKDKEMQSLVEKVACKITDTSLPIGILLRTYKHLEEVMKAHPKSKLKLNIPETLIFGFDQSISYLSTDSFGYLQL